MNGNDTALSDDGRTATRDTFVSLAVTRRTAHEHPAPDALVAWRENRLGADEAARVETHVAHCERCFETWVALCEALPARAPEAAEAWWRRLLPTLSHPVRWRPALAAALMVLVAVGAVFRFADVGEPPLAAYELDFGGSVGWRGADPETDTTAVTLRSGDRFEVRLRPATAVEESPVVQLYVDSGDGLESLGIPAAIELGQGTLAIRGVAGEDVLLPVGRSSLYVVVGRRDALPSRTSLRDRLTGRATADDDDWQGWRVTVEYQPR